MKKIYFASCYTHLDPKVMEERATKIMAKTAELIRSGYFVFSPITHSHEMAKRHNLPSTFEYWAAANHSMIDWCDTVMVLKLDGWDESKGVDDEITYAHLTKKRVVFTNQTL